MGSSDFPHWKKYLLELAGTFAMSLFGSAAIVDVLLVPWLDHPQGCFSLPLCRG
jgi:hypothetical protein